MQRDRDEVMPESGSEPRLAFGMLLSERTLGAMLKRADGEACWRATTAPSALGGLEEGGGRSRCPCGHLPAFRSWSCNFNDIRRTAVFKEVI